ncbi:hypothetical protein AGMMS49991_07380 [Spirochaetia bacterium]|nr:hypothetical protein AGMMS49991_07380 [Spirochaetia bacterium]
MSEYAENPKKINHEGHEVHKGKKLFFSSFVFADQRSDVLFVVKLFLKYTHMVPVSCLNHLTWCPAPGTPEGGHV